MYFVMVLLVYW